MRLENNLLPHKLYCLWLFLVLCLAACQTQPDLPDLAPDTIVERAADRMLDLPGFHFTIERQGDPVFLDTAQTIAFRRAEGNFVSPDRARAVVRIIAPGLVVDVNAISIGPVQWETDFATGRWRELPPDWGFNPAILFDSQIGLPAILETDLKDLHLLPPENINSGPDGWLYVVRGAVHGHRLHIVSHGLVADQEMEMTLWIDPDTFDLHRATLRLPASDGESATSWHIQLSQFGQVANIEPPDVVGQE